MEHSAMENTSLRSADMPAAQKKVFIYKNTRLQEGNRVLVIPDVHLKPWMFERASELMKAGVAERAVCLMDIADDWGKKNRINLYRETYDAAIRFAKDYPETLWCIGNHDYSYIWSKVESGYSFHAEETVRRKLQELADALPDRDQLAVIHRIGSVLFMHAGLTDTFVRQTVPDTIQENTDAVIQFFNNSGTEILWNGASPIWTRPQYTGMPLYGEGRLLQVVGHTPMKQITQEGSLITCDTFSTYRDGRPFGSQEFLVVDTETWEWEGIR